MPVETPFNRFDSKWVIPLIILFALYWLWFGLVVGVTNTEIYFFILCIFLFFWSKRTRQLAMMFSPFFIYLICYSSLKILHLYNPFEIQNESLYLLEKSLFGFEYLGETIIPCEYFKIHTKPFFDFISGFFYITWAPFPILFGLLVFFKSRAKIGLNFWICFLIANLLGFIGYICYPAAPPWYYLTYGAEIIKDAPPSAAGLIRFDQMFDINVYQNMYSQGTNTFGAMPSMHAAFPLILLYFSRKFGNKWLSILIAISMISIWFGAVYTNHHYILDVIVGIFCGILAIFITEMLVNRNFAPNWYKKTLSYIEANNN